MLPKLALGPVRNLNYGDRDLNKLLKSILTKLFTESYKGYLENLNGFSGTVR